MAPKQQRLNPADKIARAGAAHQPRNARGGRSGNPAARVIESIPPATFGDWVNGARIRTLPMAVAPVLIGTGAARLAGGPDEFHWVRALLCLAIAVFLQIGVNYANDYSDGIRGTDDQRVGPTRLVGGGRAEPRAVLTVALVFFGLAAAAGLAVTIVTGLWWLILVGIAAIAAAWFYTGGKRPYGYFALGEVFVFLFFGLVATLGTMYVQVLTLNQEAWFGAIGAGLIACAALEVNNLRDITQDKVSGKRTLSVLIGPVASRVLFCLMLLVPFVILAVLGLFYSIALFGLFGLLVALPACLIVITARSSRELILVLKLTGVVQLVYGLALFAAFI